VALVHESLNGEGGPYPGLSGTDGDRRRSPERGHLIEDAARKPGLNCATSFASRAKPVTENHLVSEEGVFRASLLVVPDLLLPLSPTDILHPRDRSVARARA